MKKFCFLFTILFSTLIFTSNSNADWTYVGKNDSGDTYYVDLNSIKKTNQGYILFWELTNYLKRLKSNVLSSKIIYMLDCNLLRDKIMSDYYYDKRNAKGTIVSSSNKPDKNWDYAPPNSMQEFVSKFVCSKFAAK